MYLLFLWKYLEYRYIWGGFIHNGAGKALPLCIYPMKYLKESLLPYDSLSASHENLRMHICKFALTDHNSGRKHGS